jgi:tetratricopeptide (TPR) repeat protein
MVREESQFNGVCAFPFNPVNSSGFRKVNVTKSILSVFSFHFMFFAAWIFGLLLAVCSTGCKHSEANPASGYPWLKNEPNNVEVRPILWQNCLDEGRQAYDAGRYEEAERLFKNSLDEAEKFGPGDYRLGQSLYWLGAVEWDMGRPVQAKPFLERALNIIEQLKGTEAAMPSRQIVIADILGRLSEIEANNKNYSLAKAYANKAVNISREAGSKKLLFVSLKSLVQINVSSGDYRGAVQSYSELIGLDPNNVSYYYDRALLNKCNGDYEPAVADLTKALELQPDHPRLLNELAWILSTCGDDKVRNGQRSVEFAQKAVMITKYKNPQCLETLAAAYAETGQFDKAVKTQQQAISLLAEQQDIEKSLAKLRLYVDHKPLREVQKTNIIQSAQ